MRLMVAFASLVINLVVLQLALSAGYSVALSAPAAAGLSSRSAVLPEEQQAERLSTAERIDLAYRRGEIDESERLLYLAYALGNYEALPLPYRGDAPWSGTLAILELQSALSSPPSALSVSAANTIRSILSGADFSLDTVSVSVRESEHFRIEYGAIAGGLTVEDYVVSLESAWETIIEQFGWAAPPVYTPNPVPGGRYLVRIAAFGDPNLLGLTTVSGTYSGLVYDNPHTDWDDFDAYASYMVLSNDFSRAYATAQQMMEGTVAHEFNHALHYGYGVLSGANPPDMIFIEGGANWIIDEVFDDSDLGHRKLWPYFDRCMGEHDGNPYFYWLTFRGLTERYGVGVSGGGEQIMQDFWEITSRSRISNMLPALDKALANKGSSLPVAFHDYAITLRFTKTCPAATPYCFEEADAYLDSVGSITDSGRIETDSGEHYGSLQDNYAIDYVGLPLREQYAIEFENQSQGGEFRVSIVADLGNELQISTFPVLIAGNESADLPFYAPPEDARRVVAVITNQHQTADNPRYCTADPYLIRLRPVDAPVADVSVKQAVSPDPVSPGAELTYTITIANAGPDPASEVILTDELPIETKFVSASVDCLEQDNAVKCVLGELPANSQQQVVLKVEVLGNQAADVSNYVEVLATEFDPQVNNNVSVQTVRLRHLFHLPLVKGT